MKKGMVFFLLTLLALPGFARTTTVMAHGQANGYCSYNSGRFCLERLRQDSERDGERRAQWRCSAEGGRSQTYTINCNTRCRPDFFTPNDRLTLVQCSSSCSMQCEL